MNGKWVATTLGHEYVPITKLQPADSPRLTGVDAEHVRILAATDAILPPILVHRPTARVIDGMHRLRAAMLRGDPSWAKLVRSGSSLDRFEDLVDVVR